MGLTKTIKYYLLRTSVAKPLKNLQAKVLNAKIKLKKSGKAPKTVYCISPYKTGTTYLASCFSPEVSQHEPLHHLTLKMLEKDFTKFFTRRMNYLQLKLECSGFWSAYIKELVKNESAKDLDYICILRAPSSWLTSVINHWNHPQSFEYRFECSLELFWKKKIGVNLHEFEIGKDTAKNREIIDKLIHFYFDFTKNTRLLKNLTYIEIKEIDNNLPLVEAMIGEDSTIQNRWKREAKRKPFIYKNESIDKEYELLTAKLIEERESLAKGPALSNAINL